MTYQDVVNAVADRLNLTSSQALTRIGLSVNERNRWVTSSLGLDPTSFVTISTTATSGNRNVVFTGITKIYRVFLTAPSPIVRLDEMDLAQLRNQAVATDPPKQYAIQLMGSNSVTIFLSTVPGSNFAIQADGVANLATLSGTDVPAWPEDYHDILIYGAMATERDKMEKVDLSAAMEAMYQQRLTALKAYIGKGQ